MSRKKLTFIKDENGDTWYVEVPDPVHVFVASPEGFSGDADLEEVEVIMTSATSIDFATDFGPLFDRWTGQPAVALVEPIDDDPRIRKVTEYTILNAIYDPIDDPDGPGVAEAAEVVGYDLIFPTWRLQVRYAESGFYLMREGPLPDTNDPTLAMLWAFVAEHGYSPESIIERESAQS